MGRARQNLLHTPAAFWSGFKVRRADEMRSNLCRRSLLTGSAAIVPGLAVLVLSRSANAFSTETMAPHSSVGLAFSKRCGSDSMHPLITARLEAELANRTAAPGTTLSETEVCPVCGCPITVTRLVH
jgi:hypothetical protein